MVSTASSYTDELSVRRIWEKLRDFDQMIQYLSNYLGVRLIPEWGYDPFVLADLL